MPKPVANQDFNTIYVNDNDGTVSGNVLANDTIESGQLYLRFVDGQRVGAKGTNTIKGDYGTFTISEDGSYTYKLDTNNAAVKALAPGETLLEKVSYKISDGGGNTDFDYLNLTIYGPNAKPVAVKDSFVSTDSLHFSDGTFFGNVLDNDTNLEATPLQAAFIYKGNTSVKIPYDGGEASLTGKYGTITIHRDGSFEYVIDKNDPDYVALATGTKVTETFSYKIYDGSDTNNSTDFDNINFNFAKGDLFV